MSSSTITGVTAWEALDSRGRPTVACRVDLANGGVGRTVVPSGASTGEHEAVELRDGGERYQGWGVLQAVENVRSAVADTLIGLDAEDQERVDAALERLDGTESLEALGANAVLASSLAVLLAVADGSGDPLWKHLSRDAAPTIPTPMVNVVSGGAHAGGLVDIQDVLVMPIGASTFTEAIEWAARVRHAAGQLLRDRGGSPDLVADEGGLAHSFSSNEAALELVTDAISAADLIAGDQVVLAIDVAASQLWKDGGYRLARENATLPTGVWIARLVEWCARYPIVSIEDPLNENDWTGWQEARRSIPSVQLIGDDLFATNEARIATGIELQAANSVLVKPNQAGNVSRTARSLARARDAGWSTVVSARSGETEDFLLADLAVGWRADQIKVGSTMRSERTAKWNRLLELEATTNSSYRAREGLRHLTP